MLIVRRIKITINIKELLEQSFIYSTYAQNEHKLVSPVCGWMWKSPG